MKALISFFLKRANDYFSETIFQRREDIRERTSVLVEVSFIGLGHRSTRRKPLTMLQVIVKLYHMVLSGRHARNPNEDTYMYIQITSYCFHDGLL